MEWNLPADLPAVLQAADELLLAPLRQVDWTAWRDTWAGQFLHRRHVVVYFLPLVPVLLLLRRDGLRAAIVLTGLLFLGYVCGVLYAGLWLLTCLALHALGERFARELQRTDVWPGAPPLAAGALVAGWYLVTMVLHEVELPAAANGWLLAHAPWVFPLGARGLAFEPLLGYVHPGAGSGRPPQLLHALFWDPHFIGTAYLAVRMLHYLSEIRRGTIPRERRTRLDFLAYACYGPALLQGPIERYGPFQEELDTCHQRRGWRHVPGAAWRIGLGVAKSIVAVVYFYPRLGTVYGLGGDNRLWLHPEQIAGFWTLYFGVFFVIFTLYLEFSGYCDVVVGIGRLFGYRQVENFNMPWLATSLRDFWHRWHITLSHIVRDYLYIPFGGNRRHVTLNLCLAFLLVGLWHRLMFQVAAWGVLMGLMIAVNQRWARWMKALDAAPGGALPAIRRAWLRLRPLPRVCAWLLTQHAFLFSLLLFFGGEAVIHVPVELIRRLVAGGP